jgi:hypothetical protein
LVIQKRRVERSSTLILSIRKIKQLGTRWMLPKLPLFCEKMVNLKMRDEYDLFLLVEEETSSSTAGTKVIFR